MRCPATMLSRCHRWTAPGLQRPLLPPSPENRCARFDVARTFSVSAPCGVRARYWHHAGRTVGLQLDDQPLLHGTATRDDPERARATVVHSPSRVLADERQKSAAVGRGRRVRNKKHTIGPSDQIQRLTQRSLTARVSTQRGADQKGWNAIAAILFSLAGPPRSRAGSARKKKCVPAPRPTLRPRLDRHTRSHAGPSCRCVPCR